MADERFNCTIGASITETTAPRWFDTGVVYTGLRYDQVVAIEGVLAAHAEEINRALSGVIGDLVALGIAQVDAGETKVGQPPKR